MKYNRRTVEIITPPASLPVTAADMEAFLGLQAGIDTAMLTAFIDAACDGIRQYLRRSLVAETLELRMDGFPGYDESAELALGPGMHVVSIPYLTNRGGSVVDLPFGPVASIISITTYGRDNAASVFPASQYEYDASRVYLNEGATWPTDLRRRDAVAIRYVSGDADCPASIVHAIRQWVAAMYDCREGCQMPPACVAKLAPYRRLDPMGFQ